MNSALKPSVLNPGISSSAAQQSNNPNKAMHPQGGASAAYGQSQSHMAQSHMQQSHMGAQTHMGGHSMGLNMPHNTNVAHATQNQNHYSLNVPNSTHNAQHYMGNSASIPVSNHPVANVGGQGQGGQVPAYQQKAPTNYSGGYQPNLGHPPNQNAMPPVSQTLPATNTQPSTPSVSAVPAQEPTPVPEKPQSNGTLETPPTIKPTTPAPSVPSPVKPDNTAQQSPQQSTTATSQENHVKEIKVPEKVEENVKTLEKPTPVVPTESTVKTAESVTAVLPANLTNSTSNVSPATNQESSTESKEEEVKKEEPKVEEVKISNEKEENLPQASEGSKSNQSEESVKEEEKKESTTEIPVKTPEQESSPPKTTQPEPTPAATPEATAAPKTPTRRTKTPKAEDSTPKTPKPETTKNPALQKSPASAVGKIKRQRIRTQPYQSPLPEIDLISKISSTSSATPKGKKEDEKLIVFYKNEFLAVRNSEGTFYVCQAVQNIYKSSTKIKIRWLSQDKDDKSGEIYTPDFYDLTDFDCILTNLNLGRVDKGKYRLPNAEKERTEKILNRSLAVENGEEVHEESFTEEHPDGLDISLYTEESQLNKKKKAPKRKASPSKSDTKTATKKTPQAAKVRKVAKSAKKKPPAKKQPVAKPSTSKESVKKAAPSSSRAGRAKRRGSDIKTSPVVDSKKAKVLAKMVKKINVPAKAAPQAMPKSYSSKTKPAPKKATAAKGPKPTTTATRKTKRSTARK